MLPTDAALVGAQEPPLEERGDSVNSREHRLGVLLAAEEGPPVMVVAETRKSTVALQTIRDDGRARRHGLLDKRQEAVCRGVRYPPQANPTDRATAHLRRDGHQGCARGGSAQRSAP